MKPRFKRDDFKLIADDTRYDGHFAIHDLTLQHQRYEGGWSEPYQRECLVRSDSVAVVPYDPQQDSIVLIEQLRIGCVRAPAMNPFLLEIVAGCIEADEVPAAVAVRELQEETGLVGRAVERICDFWTTPGGCTERTHLYYAIVDASLAGGVHGLVHEEENILSYVLPAQTVFDMVAHGEICSAISLVGLQWLALNHQRIRQQWQEQ